jgi:heme oxygenase
MTAESDVDLPLTDRLNIQTRSVHEKSDKLVNLKLSMVLTSKHLYAEAISLFWPIYSELEDLMEKHKNHEKLKQLYPLLEILRRSSRFENDIRWLLGSDELYQDLMQRRFDEHGNKREIRTPAELKEYIDHLRELSDKTPMRLVAYIYAQYSAIMAGGSIIKRIVKNAYAIRMEEGVEIFSFDCNDKFENTKIIRNRIKHILNEQMGLSEDEKLSIIDEAPQVFVRNNALVGTVTDTSVFARATHDCIWYMLSIFLAILAALVALIAFYAHQQV